MFSCKHATRLVSEGMDRPLPLLKRIGVCCHLVLCPLCARFKRHLLFVRRAVRQHRDALEGADPATAMALPPAARERIAQLLRQHAG